MENKLKITNKNQMEHLISSMEINKQLARGVGQFGCSKQETKQVWERISDELNGLGPPHRTSLEWQRVWIHYKANLKRKLAKNKSSLSATGGGPLQEISLSQSEERVLELTHINTSINPPGKTMGLMKEKATSPNVANVETPRPGKAKVDTPLNTRNTNARETRDGVEAKKLKLLCDQTETQSEFLGVLKNIDKYQMKIYDLKKKKFELFKKSQETKNDLLRVKLEIANQKLAELDKYE